VSNFIYIYTYIFIQKLCNLPVKYICVFHMILIIYSEGLRPEWPGLDSLKEEQIFFHNVQTGYGAHLPFCPTGAGGSFPGGKAAEA
jgi:hypothetical protein